MFVKDRHALSFCALALAATALGGGSCLPDVILDAPPAPRACGDGVLDPAAGEQCDPGSDAGEAGIVGCGADCRISCAGALDPTSGHCYFVLGASARVQAGRERCATTGGGHLVTYASADELGFVDKRLLADAGAPLAWANLDREDADGSSHWRTDLAEPGWSGACPGCFAKAPVEAGAFPTADGGPGGACVLVVRAYPYTWFAAPCDLGALGSFATVCEREPPGRLGRPCDAGTCIAVPRTAADRTYVYVTAPLTWSGATQACAALPGPLGPGKLFAPESAEEREEVARAVVADKGQSFWIGLSRSGGEWKWSDGKSLSSLVYPIPWGDGAPEATGDAAYLETNASLYDVTLAHADDPSAPRPFVCSFELR